MQGDGRTMARPGGFIGVIRESPPATSACPDTSATTGGEACAPHAHAKNATRYGTSCRSAATLTFSRNPTGNPIEIAVVLGFAQGNRTCSALPHADNPPNPGPPSTAAPSAQAGTGLGCLLMETHPPAPHVPRRNHPDQASFVPKRDDHEQQTIIVRSPQRIEKHRLRLTDPVLVDALASVSALPLETLDTHQVDHRSCKPRKCVSALAPWHAPC